MSMTYYAVTDDPNELAHFGILGMKWGRRRTPEQLGHPRHSGSRRPRSAAYKKAQSKLGLMMKSGIEKAKANWRTYNSPYAKEERFMKKAMQQARNGTLKYGKLTDDQVQRVTDRLYLERQARQLGSTENPSFGKRIRTAVSEGVVRGIGQGTASYIDARFKGRGETTAAIKKDERMAKYEGRKNVQQRRAQNKQLEEFYKTAAEEGINPDNWRYTTQNQRARYLASVKEKNRQDAIRKQNEESFNRSYYTNMGKNAADWAKSNASSEHNSDWESQQSRPRLTSGSPSYSVTRNTYGPLESDTVIYVDPRGNARKKQRTGRKRTRVNYG